MRWHLVTMDGFVLRSTDADSIGQARFRLAPIPPDASVVSALAQATTLPQHAPTKPTKRTHSEPPRWGVNDIRRNLILAASVEGINDMAIGRELGITGQAVGYVRRKMGLPSADERTHMAIRAYHTLGWPTQRIAERIGMHQPNVLYALRRMGLKSKRPHGGQKKGVTYHPFPEAY